MHEIGSDTMTKDPSTLGRGAEAAADPGLKSALKRRRWFWRVAVTVLIVGLGPYLYSRVKAPFQRVQISTRPGAVGNVSEIVELRKQVRVVTYNIAHGRGKAPSNWTEGGTPKRKRILEIAEFLKSQNADIVVLNEVDFCCTWSGHQNQAAAIADAAGYHYVIEQRNLDFRFAYGSFQFGNAILSHFPIAHAEQISFPAEKAWEDWLVGSKRGVVATIRTSRTQMIRIAAVHLEHRSESTRVAGAKVLEGLIDPLQTMPLIVAGDFNSTPEGFPASSQNSDGANAMDSLFASGGWQRRPLSEPTEAELTFSSIKPKSVIDWILVSGDRFPIREYRVVQSELSDHFAVLADVDLIESPDSSGRPPDGK